MKHTDLRRKRTSLGLTQASLAERLGVSLRHFIRWENGHAEIPILVGMALEYLLLTQKKIGTKVA